MALTRRGSRLEKEKKISLERKSTEKVNDDKNVEEPKVHLKYKLTSKKIFTRIALCSLIIIMVYYQTKNSKKRVFAQQNELIQLKTHEVPCSKDYQNELSMFPGCTPLKCGRVVSDEIITPQESYELLQLAKKGLALGGAFGGVSILDIHSGALSQGDNFVNAYKIAKERQLKNVFTHETYERYRAVKNKIQRMVALHFGIRAKNIYLTQPTFFSKMMNIPARTKHDEYWHVHVDKDTYKSFHYTSLLYLSDYGIDFQGGQFHFADKSGNMTLEPKMGRVLAFTSGSENPHQVEPVTNGERFALTISFTCDKKLAITTPTIRKL